MKLVIHRTYKLQVVAVVNTVVTTPVEYITYLRKLNVEIDMLDAIKDIVANQQVDLTLPIEMDYDLSMDV